MREIKFRAWDKENQDMTYGIDLQYRNGKLCMLRHDNWMGDGEPEANINWDGIAPIEEFELMQYTGLKDKNGKEIYEGDIVSYPDTESDYVDVGIGVGLKCAEMSCYGLAPVIFARGTFGLDCCGGESLGKGFHSFEWITDTYGFTFNDLEVIGNIYENPELLEK